MNTHAQYSPPPRRRTGQHGFTLVELLVVVVILGILAGIVAFGVARYRQDAVAAACAADVATVARAAAAYEARTGDWPDSVEPLVSGEYLKSTPGGSYRFDATAKTVTRDPACPPPGSTAPHTNTVGVITGIGNKCVAAAGNATADGTPIYITTCASGAAGQQFRLPASYPGPVMVLGKCIGAAGGATTNRTRVVLQTCDGSAGQQWELEDSGDMLTNPQSGRCFDAENATSNDGTLLIIWDCHGNANQRWVLP